MRIFLLTSFLFACQPEPLMTSETDANNDSDTEFADSVEDETETESETGDDSSSDDDESDDIDDESDDEIDDIDDESDDGADADDWTEEIPALSVSGTEMVTSMTGSFAAASDCTITYTRYQPMSGASLGEAFILHGFMRGQDQFADLASHLASWGITSTTVDLCHSSITDVDAEQNSRDVIDLAENLGADRVVWMGQSNGGVSALIAGGMAPEITVGILGLDPVESYAGTGADWSATVTSPAAALFGISDSCNDSNSGYPVYSAADESTSLRISESDHCSFEFPTGLLCTALCERPRTLFTNTDISRTILEFSTAWALARLDTTFDASSWWTVGGERYETLLERGAIAPM